MTLTYRYAWTPTTQARLQPLRDRLTAVLRRWLRRLYRERALAALTRLTDHQLAAIGTRRSEIPAFVDSWDALDASSADRLGPATNGRVKGERSPPWSGGRP